MQPDSLKVEEKSKFTGLLQISLRFLTLHRYVSAKHHDKKTEFERHIQDSSLDRLFFFSSVYLVFGVLFCLKTGTTVLSCK